MYFLIKCTQIVLIYADMYLNSLRVMENKIIAKKPISGVL